MFHFSRYVLWGTSILVSVPYVKNMDTIIFVPFFLIQIAIFYEFIVMLFGQIHTVSIHFFFIYLSYFSIIHLFLHPQFFLAYYSTLYLFFLSFVTYDENDNQKEMVEKIKIFLENCPECMDGSEECYICLENSIETTRLLKKLPCGHSFHKECLVKWFESSIRQISDSFMCPVCRQSILSEDDQNENC